MFVLIAIILGLIIGFIRGGSFKGFKAKKISLLPLGIIGIILQFGLHLYYYTGGIEAVDAFLPVVNFISYILILVMLVFNLDDFWTIMMAVGITANFIVTFINGGKMPVASKIVESLPATSAFATSINEGTNAVYAVMQQSGLWVLGVNVPIPFVGGFMQYIGSIGGFSIGSAVVFIGLIGWVQYAMNRVPADSVFNKDEPIGEEDYILPPDEDDEDDFFDDYDDENDDYYPEEDFEEDPIENLEGSFESMTDVIPKLTPEAIAEIQNNGGDSSMGKSILDEYDPSQDTKVFTAIKDIGTYEPTEVKEDFSDEDTGPVSGFFTQSFYAEKEKGKLAFEKEQEEIKTEEKPEEKVPKQRVVIQEPVINIDPVPQPQPVVVEEKTPFVVEDDKIVSNPEYGATMINTEKEERTEDDMLSIWQQVNQEQERIRARKRRRTRYVDVKEPFKAEREKVAAEKAVARAAAVAKAQAVTEAQPVHRQITPEELQAQTIAAQQAAAAVQKPAEPVITPPIEEPAAPVNTAAAPQQASVYDSSAKVKASSADPDEERERAGYERVKLNVDGKDVVFWRKKKD